VLITIFRQNMYTASRRLLGRPFSPVSVLEEAVALTAGQLSVRFFHVLWFASQPPPSRFHPFAFVRNFWKWHDILSW